MSTSQQAAASESSGGELTAAEKARLSELQSQIYEASMRANAPNPEGTYAGNEEKRQAFERGREQYRQKAESLRQEFESLKSRAAPEVQAAISQGGKRSTFQSEAIAVQEYGGNFFPESGQYHYSSSPAERETQKNLSEIAKYYPYATQEQVFKFYNKEESESELSKQDAERAGLFGDYTAPKQVRGFSPRPGAPPNVETNYEATLAARQAGFNVGSGLSTNLPETFQKDFNKRFAEHNKQINLVENIHTSKAPATIPIQPKLITPQNPRKHILTGQPEKLNANPEFAQKGSNEKQGIKPQKVELTETINPITGKPEYSSAPKTENLSGLLFNVEPKKPKKLSQAEVNALSDAEYVEYRKQIENYNAFVGYSNEKIQAQNKANILVNRANFESNRKAIADYVADAKKQGIKFVTIQTPKGFETIPIDKALRKNNIIQIAAVPVVPEGYTVTGTIAEPVLFPEGRQFVGPEKPQEQDYLKNIGNLFGAEAAGVPESFPKYQYEKGRVTSEQVPIVTKSYSKGPITVGIEGMKSPLEKGAEFAEGVGTGLLRTSLIITNAMPEAFIKIAQTGDVFAGEQTLQEHEKFLRGLGVGPSVLPSVESGAPTGRSAYYNLGEATGEILPFLAGLGSIKNPFSRSPIKPKAAKAVPTAEAPEIAKPSTLNDFYREPLKLETPEQQIVRQSRQERIINARIEELKKAGAEKALIKFNPRTEKIEKQIFNIPLGEGDAFVTKGVPNPPFSVSGEAPESTMLKELQKKNILENEKRAELSDVLSPGAIEKMTPKKPEVKIFTEKETKEIRQGKQETPKLLQKEEQKIEPVLKVDLKKRIREDLFKKHGFTKETISLGEGKGELLTISATGAGAVVPLPFVIVHAEEEENPITNQTQGNATITNSTLSLPPIVEPAQSETTPDILETETTTERSAAKFGAAATTPSGLLYGINALNARRTAAKEKVKPITESKKGAPLIILTTPKESTKEKRRTAFLQPQEIKQPELPKSVFPVPQTPASLVTPLTAPITKPKEKLKERERQKEPPPLNFGFARARDFRRKKAKALKPDAFVGNVSDVDIALGFNRKEITPGIKTSEKRYKKDILFAYKRAGFTKLVTQRQGSILSKKQRSILEREKPKEVKKQKKRTGGFF